MDNQSDIHEFIDNEEYRDTIATVDSTGKRIWLYPKKFTGSFHNKRILATIVFLAIFLSGPFIKINGQPLLMINIFERKFVIFGQLFLPQDFVIFGLGMIAFFVFIILFTVVYGRIWCGWLCPQTVFMEMIFRKVEFFFEGDWRKQKKFDESPWTADKILRKTAKHFIYIVFSAIIAHFTMAYLIGLEGTIDIITHSPSEHFSGFIGIIAFTGIFYFVFARLREQVCIAICPYGRLQGVLVNRETMNIIYDNVRGEPRGRLNKKQAVAEVNTKQGDCVDCSLCVHVCPTGIDIRNGVQLECVNCTACIDACDEVMDKVDKPRGLIRYASVESVEKGKPFRMSKRAIAYSIVLFLLICVEAALILSRSKVETTLMRVPGQMYQELPNGKIANLYNAQMVNKSNEDMNLTLKVVDNVGEIRFVGGKKAIHVTKGGRTDIVFFLDMPKSIITKLKTQVTVEVYEGDQLMETLKTNFLGPQAP
jgi:cytochrome c oxidase accessory protein FixG